MKKVFFLFAVLFSIISFAQHNINFETTTFAEILAKAKKEKKFVFLDAYAVWCGPCKMMERNVFTDASVASYYNSNFVNARIDMEKGEGRDIAMQYSIRSYPTLLVLNGDGDVVGKEMGYLDAKQFLDFGKKNNNPKLLSSNLKEEYLKGTLDQPALLSFITMTMQKDPSLAKQASEKYFAQKKDKTFSPDEINVLFTFTQSVDDANYKVLTQNKTAILELVPEKNYTQFENYLKLMKIINNATDEKSHTIDKAKILSEGKGLLSQEDLEKSLNIYVLNYYSAHEKFAEYEKVALEYYKNPNSFNANELLTAASIFNDHVSNIASLKVATQWIEKIVMNQESFDTLSLLAELYDKTGKKDEAKMFAEMAINYAKQENRDTTKMNEIINKK